MNADRLFPTNAKHGAGPSLLVAAAAAAAAISSRLAQSKMPDSGITNRKSLSVRLTSVLHSRSTFRRAEEQKSGAENQSPD